MEEKKYYVSFLRMFSLFYLGWVLIIFITMFKSPTLINFIAVSLTGVIVIGIIVFIFVIMNPLKINENGFIVKSQGTRTVFTKWEVINWTDINGIKPTTIIFYHYIRIIYNGGTKSITIPLSVINKCEFVEDLIRYVPDENPLKVFIKTGKSIQVAMPTQADDLISKKPPYIKVDERFNEERFKVEHALKSGANWLYWIAGLSLINNFSVW